MTTSSSPSSSVTPTITVIGLGPGDPDLVTSETLREIDRVPIRFLRTTQHPSAFLVNNATSFDSEYETADRFDEVYQRIADRLAAAAHEHGEVLYAVPGSPLVLERTVSIIRTRTDIATRVLPAISFLDAVWSALGIDPVDAGVRLVDGHRFAVEAAGERGPLLVAHVHADWVLSEIRHSLDAGPDDDLTIAADDTRVVVLKAIGTNEQQITETTWAKMESAIEPDHLTSLFIPELAVPIGAGYVKFHQLARTLRERCPWDIEQTHESLVRYLIEESFEVVDAIDERHRDGGDDHLIEELGDLLYQIEFHATIAEQEGRFTIADITQSIHDKLVRRHPHVFGTTVAADATEVRQHWEDAKAKERAETGDTHSSALDGVARSLPALSQADGVQRKAAKVGFDWPDLDGPVEKVREETAEVLEAHSRSDEHATRHEIGDLLFAVVNLARHLEVEPEAALRSATARFAERFRLVEHYASNDSLDLHELSLETLDALWERAKDDLNSLNTYMPKP